MIAFVNVRAFKIRASTADRYTLLDCNLVASSIPLTIETHIILHTIYSLLQALLFIHYNNTAAQEIVVKKGYQECVRFGPTNRNISVSMNSFALGLFFLS